MSILKLEVAKDNRTALEKAARAALAQSMAEAARFITEHGFVGQGAPVMIRLASETATRFGIVVS